MAALVAGVQYALTSQGHLNDNKSLIFVKLTDSALRAIEEYLKIRNKSSQTPTIQFLGNEGHLSLPTAQSSRGKAGFKFSLSNNSDIGGPQGSFECVQHTHSGQKCIESIGTLPCKMRVQANEDVYETTRSRMQAAEKLQKETCTREIEMEKAIGRRVKIRKPIVNGISPIGPRRPLGGASLPPSNHTPPIGHTRPQGNNHAQKPGNPEIMRRPIRDRIIQLLAVRPFKKPELFMALSRDGLKDKDRNNLMNTIKSVATVKDNTYHLMRHMWNDVQEDWPFYTDQEKQMLKRRKPENLTPPGSSDGGSSQSPSSVHPGSPPSASEPITTAKRPGYIDGADGLPTKRQRISHYRKPTPPGAGQIESSPVMSQPKLPDPAPPTPPQESSPPKYPIDYPPKYLIEYTTIKDTEQRRRYKDDFNANYNEYKQLHSMVEKVSKRFTQLDERLKREERESEAWQRIKEQIMKEYIENKKNTRHQDAKRRFQYLHEKLSHIKKLVMEYDTREYPVAKNS